MDYQKVRGASLSVSNRHKGNRSCLASLLLLLLLIPMLDHYLRATDLRYAAWRSRDLQNTNWSRQTYYHYNGFNGLDLRNATLLKMDLGIVSMRNCNLANVVFTGSDIHMADFSYSNLRNANLKGVSAFHTSFYKVNLQEASLVNANLSQAILDGADLRGANLTGTCLSMSAYDAQTKWPIGFTSQRLKALGAIKDLDLGQAHYGRQADK